MLFQCLHRKRLRTLVHIGFDAVYNSPCRWGLACLEQEGELAVAEGDMRRLLGEGTDAIAQGRKGAIDELRLLEPLPCCSSL